MNITIDTKQHNLILHPTPAPDWDEFLQWGENLINQLENSRINQQDIGADRHKLTFTFAHHRFSLNYETYTDSYWIEIDEPAAQQCLIQLYEQLQKQIK